MKHFNKKGVIDDLGNLITSLGVLAILAAVIFLIIAETQDQIVDQDPCGTSVPFYNSTSGLCQTAAGAAGTPGYSHSYNASVDLQGATSDIPGWFPIVVITIIGGVLLTLVRFFRK